MTLDEAIKREKDIAEENQKIVDTRIIFDDVTLDEFFCDDTEVIEEHLVRYQMCADEHRQIAEWLKELKESIDYKAQYESYLKKSEIVISQLREDRDRLLDTLDKIKDGIMQLDYDLEDVDNDMAQTEPVHIISREGVLQIIQRIKENKQYE